MKCLIKETNEVKEIERPDGKPRDWLLEKICQDGDLAVESGEAYWDSENECFVCNQDTFDFWETVFLLTEEYDDIEKDLLKKYGYDAVDNAMPSYSTGGDSVDFANSRLEAIKNAKLILEQADGASQNLSKY